MKISKNKEEAEVTVRKTKEGKYIDLSKNSLVGREENRLSDEQLMGLFEKLRLRFTLTPQCNLWCFFCSNEGSSYTDKQHRCADIEYVIKLSEMLLEKTPLKSIDLSGGEPTLHPDFMKRSFKLCKWTKKYPNTRFSLHSNGVTLDPEIIDVIKDNFSRIGFSIHSVNFKTWNRITNLNQRFSDNVQMKKFERMIGNLKYLSKQNIGEKVFLKAVIIKGVNDTKKELIDFLETCEKYNFHPKFLEFEPQFKDQNKYVVRRKEIFEKLEKIGCKFQEDTPRHNNPDTYIPGVNFKYKNAPLGLHSIFGCGLEAACRSCYDFLCMFVKPHNNRKGLYLKPCSVLDTRIDLTHAIDQGDYKQLLNLFRLSREYLMLAPGLGVSDWKKEEDYNLEK
jgi:molybdenum cofactor biosynthesis enzyme MoaA